ncbi:MAG: iron-containing alcohol dehydrogenase [Planctomycetota bacterium]|nr:iron-containing alcohol dehydrogenase [Planctomycetota bacterium]
MTRHPADDGGPNPTRPSRPEGPIGFDHRPRTHVIFGAGCVGRAGELGAELGLKRVLLVTDPGVVRAGHAGRVQESLKAAGLEAVLFDRVRENPTTREVAECLAAAREARIDGLVGLGGGSSMDTAKGCNFLYSNGGRMQDYWGVGLAKQPMLPLLCIPTTAGTGSECQSFALIADEETHRKMACGDPKAAARLALLDPELTVSQPRHVTANTGIDAVAHAVETAVTRRRNELSWLYAREAFVLGRAALPRTLAEPSDVAARGRMQWAAALAGMAIENSMLGAAHAAANPLTARYGAVHGMAVGLMLPHVVRFNTEDPQARALYAVLAASAGLAESTTEPRAAAAALVRGIGDLLDAAGFPRSLEACGARREDIPALAEDAAVQWTATFNPREIGAADFRALYEAAFAPRA